MRHVLLWRTSSIFFEEEPVFTMSSKININYDRIWIHSSQRCSTRGSIQQQLTVNYKQMTELPLSF